MLRAALLALTIAVSPAGPPNVEPAILASAFSGTTTPNLDCSAGAASCLSWTGTIPVDGALAWTTNGAPTAAPVSPLFPGGTGDARQGLGPFSDTNWFGYATTSDPLDSAGDRYGCVAFTPGPIGTQQFIFINATSTTEGYYVDIFPGGTLSFGSMTVNVATLNIVVPRALNVGCWWRTGTTLNVKLNLGTTNTNVSGGTETPGTSSLARIGRYSSVGVSFNGIVYDMVQGLGAPAGFGSVEAWATAQMNRAFTTGDTTRSLFFDNVNDRMHLVGQAYSSGSWSGPAWTATLNGSVPTSRTYSAPAVTGKINAPGVKGLSDSNYYSFGTGSDPLDSIGDRWGCAVFNPGALGTAQTVVSNGLSGTAGYQAQVSAAGALVFASNVPAATLATTGNAAVSNAINVGCWWRTGTSISAKLNLGTTATNAAGGTEVAGTAYSLKVGRYEGASQPFAGTIYGVIQGLGACPTPPPPFAATCEGWATWEQTRTLGHLSPMNTALTVTRATTTTVDFGPSFGTPSLWTVPPDIMPTGPYGAEVWAAGTNAALQSETSCVANAVQAPWAAIGTPTCVSDAGTAPDGLLEMDRWTNTTNTHGINQTVTSASATTFVASGWMAAPSGSGTATLQIGVLTTASACACGTSDGSACTASQINTNYCQAKFTALTAIPIRGWVTGTGAGATTAPIIAFFPGDYTVATGTTDFYGAQVEVGAYPTPYCPTVAATCTRNLTTDTFTVPDLSSNTWCMAITATPGLGQTWAGSAGRALLWAGLGVNANTAGLYVTSTAQPALRTHDSAGTLKSAVMTSSVPANGITHRIVGCANQGTLTMALDDALVATTPGGAGTALFNAAPTPGRLGYDGNGAATLPWSGSVRDARFYPNQTFRPGM
jgi:hypothetical protein